MKSQLLAPYTIKSVEFKNRVMMSPMCMYSVFEQDGKVTDFHLTHYGTRALGQVGLIMVESTAVLPNGRISQEDLGIWSDDHIAGLTKLVDHVHEMGAKIGIQLNHAGRKADVPDSIVAPSSIAYSEAYQEPEALSENEITEIVKAFKDAVIRCQKAGFDVIELHGAHGYLINQFLSPLTNKRTDQYGGPIGNRYRFLSQIIAEVRELWEKPLFVRISAEDYQADGAHLEDYLMIGKWMRDAGIDLIDVSTGGLVNVQPTNIFPGYQVHYAEEIRKVVGIATGAVGLITNGAQAEEVIGNGRADLVVIGRELLRNPFWVREVAIELNAKDQLKTPVQYLRGWR